MTDTAESTPRAGLADLLIIIAVLVAVKQFVLQFTVVYAGPASTFTAIAVATYLLHRRGMGWRDLGFRWPENWLKTLGWSALIFGAFVLTAQGMSVLADLFFEDVGASGRFDFVEGNLGAYLLIMALVWTHGSFFEELLFRAFVITKAETALGGSRLAMIGAVVLSAAFFGYRHYYYQGMHGALVTGGIGLVFGAIYAATGRRALVPLIIVHGIANSISQTSRYLG